MHIPGYQYCVPGTKLTKRLACGDPGIYANSVIKLALQGARSAVRNAGGKRNVNI